MAKFSPLVSKVLKGVDKRTRKKGSVWEGIVIHHTSVNDKWPNMSDAEKEKHSDNIASYLADGDDKAYVSAHFQISHSGKIIQIIDPETHVAYHAGVSSWFIPSQGKVVSGMNDYMIGIELVGDGNKYPYTEAQYRACAALCTALRMRYQIYANMIVGHDWIAPGRKTDPGKLFDWNKLFDYMGIVS